MRSTMPASKGHHRKGSRSSYTGESWGAVRPIEGQNREDFMVSTFSFDSLIGYILPK